MNLFGNIGKTFFILAFLGIGSAAPVRAESVSSNRKQKNVKKKHVAAKTVSIKKKPKKIEKKPVKKVEKVDLKKNEKPKPDKSDYLVKSNSLEKLSMAALYLRSIVDAASDNSLPLNKRCGLTGKQALRMTQPMKELLDRKIQFEAARYPHLPGSNNDRKDCAERCLCGTYLDLYEAIGDAKLTPEQRSEKPLMQQLASQMTPQQAAACVLKSGGGFCKGSIDRYLREKAPRPE